MNFISILKGRKQQFLPKNLLIIKICSLLLVCCNVMAFGADNHTRDPLVSVNMKNATLESVLNYIEETTSYSFLYNKQQVDVGQRIDISQKDQPISVILDILFKTGENNKVYEYMEWGTAGFKDVAINNFYYYITTIIDEKGAGFALLILGVFLMVMTFFKTAATYLSSYFMIPLRSGIVRDIRNYVYEKVVSLPIGFFTSEKKGDVMARMSGDVGDIENSIMASLDMMFKNPIMIIVCLATMFAISWQLTLFVLILLPTAGYIMGQVGKKLKRRSLEGQNQWGLLMSIIEETLGGLRIVKAFNAEDKMIKWFHDDNNRFYRILLIFHSLLVLN